MLKEQFEFDRMFPALAIRDELNESIGQRKVFYRLGESELFTYANHNFKAGGLNLVDVIPRVVMTDKGFDHIGLEKMSKELQYELFDSGRFKLNCKGAIRRLVDTGKVVPVYSDEYRLPISIPYIVQLGATAAQNKVYVNITDFVEMDQYGKYNINQPRNYNALMAAIVAGCVSYNIVTMGAGIPAQFADGMILFYSAMMERAINSLIHMDPVTKEKVRYLACEFALVQMYGTEDGLAKFQRYKTTYFPKLSKMITDSLDDQFKEDSFDKISTFLEELARQYPSMRGLKLFNVYEKWLRSYGSATAMSLDYLGYHIYTVVMVLMESPLITRTTLEPMLEKAKGAEMYKAMQNMIK